MAEAQAGSSRSVVAFSFPPSVSVGPALRRTSPKTICRLRRVSVTTVFLAGTDEAPGSSPTRTGASSLSTPCSAMASTPSGAPAIRSVASAGTVPATGAGSGTA